ncbi:MAG: PHB depolymerase family esterase [Pseudomonadota bacterium]
MNLQCVRGRARGWLLKASAPPSGARWQLVAWFALALLLLPTLPARAAWNAQADTVRAHRTWIYTPASTLAGGRRGLLIVLHGCVQGIDELKQFGGFEAGAQALGMVVALPAVGQRVWQGSVAGQCWDYDRALDAQGNLADIIALAETLKGRAALDIDPRHVYVAGLSAGGALALALACQAPDLFAGVAALAGPSVGSSQDLALNEAYLIPSTNVAQAVAQCRELAGAALPALSSQVANVGFGDMDMDGGAARYPFFLLSSEGRLAHAGQISLVSARWSRDNAAALQQLYGTGALGPAHAVQDGWASEQVATRGAQARLALLVVRGVGHAWPAGTAGAAGAIDGASDGAMDAGAADPAPGLWISRQGLAYPDYLMRWLVANNLRARLGPAPRLSVAASVAGARALHVSGTAAVLPGMPAQRAPRLDIALREAGSDRLLARHLAVAADAGGRYSDRFSVTQDGAYVVEVALARGGRGATVLSDPVRIGPAPPPAPPPCFSDSNVNHVLAGRAQPCLFGEACATGSGDPLGWLNLFVDSSVQEDRPGYFRLGACPAR